MSLKSFLFSLAIFCGGYVSNTLLDSAVDAAQTYFHFQTSTYKTDANGYIICSAKKPKIENDNLRALTANALGEKRPGRTARLHPPSLPQLLLIAASAAPIERGRASTFDAAS